MVNPGGVADNRWMDKVHGNIRNPRGKQRLKVRKRNRSLIGEWSGLINWQKQANFIEKLTTIEIKQYSKLASCS